MDQMAVWQLQETRNPFVLRVVGVEILALQSVVAFAAEIESYDVGVDVVRILPLGECQKVALRLAHLIEQRGGRGPEGVVERSVVKRCQDAVQRRRVAHEGTFASTSLLESEWPSGNGGYCDDRAHFFSSVVVPYWPAWPSHRIQTGREGPREIAGGKMWEISRVGREKLRKSKGLTPVCQSGQKNICVKL